MMERKLERRIEILVPILDPHHRAWIRDVLLARYLQDRARSRLIGPDGTYTRVRSSPIEPDVHEQFMAGR